MYVRVSFLTTSERPARPAEGLAAPNTLVGWGGVLRGPFGAWGILSSPRRVVDPRPGHAGSPLV